MKVVPTLDKKFVYRWVATLALIGQMSPIIFELGKAIDKYYYTPHLIKNSYVSEIKGDLLDVELTKKHLDNFNKLGNNKLVRYKPTENPRPITIEIRALGVDFYEEMNKDMILAYARADERGCKIVIRNDLTTEVQFRNTLIHEFLHCYFYEHVRDESDLMASEDNPHVNLEGSIQKYAKEVERRLDKIK